jgi:hypothetical protein
VVTALFGKDTEKCGKENVSGFGGILGECIGNGRIGINRIKFFSIIILKFNPLFPHTGKGREQFSSLGDILDHKVELGLRR